jgi:DNA-binding XRE family transcriptional regulator
MYADKTQEEMGAELGVSRDTYISLENNPTRITYAQGKKISEVTGVPLDLIIFLPANST